MTLSVVILAAGKGSRMFSEKPKVLHELSNQPLLQYVINAAKNLKPVNINVVVGYKSELVEQEFLKEDINWVAQKEQLGTGDAVKYTTPFMEGSQTMVLYGDVPLIDHDDLKKLYTRYKVFISSSLYEGNPKAILEAMSMGCVLVSSKIINVEEIVKDNENGRLFNFSNNELQPIIDEILTDEKKYKKLSKNAKETVQKDNNIMRNIKIELNLYDYLIKC